MTLINPYTSPLTDEEPLTGYENMDPESCYRDGKYVVVAQEARLPNTCVVCNVPVTDDQVRFHKVGNSECLPSFKHVNLRYGICTKHALLRRTRFFLFVAVVIIVIGIAIALVLRVDRIDSSDRLVGILSIIACFAGFLLFDSRAGSLIICKSRAEHYWIANVVEPLLQSLPDLNEND